MQWITWSNWEQWIRRNPIQSQGRELPTEQSLKFICFMMFGVCLWIIHTDSLVLLHLLLLLLLLFYSVVYVQLKRLLVKFSWSYFTYDITVMICLSNIKILIIIIITVCFYQLWIGNRSQHWETFEYEERSNKSWTRKMSKLIVIVINWMRYKLN